MLCVLTYLLIHRLLFFPRAFTNRLLNRHDHVLDDRVAFGLPFRSIGKLIKKKGGWLVQRIDCNLVLHFKQAELGTYRIVQVFVT